MFLINLLAVSGKSLFNFQNSNNPKNTFVRHNYVVSGSFPVNFQL